MLVGISLLQIILCFPTHITHMRNVRNGRYVYVFYLVYDNR